ncbi:hypothetical protein TIFTF001_027675 [Ficus carica]|nr:hypothetical protein TIFTF001_027675 [Ficus carica]
MVAGKRRPGRRRGITRPCGEWVLHGDGMFSQRHGLGEGAEVKGGIWVAEGQARVVVGLAADLSPKFSYPDLKIEKNQTDQRPNQRQRTSHFLSKPSHFRTTSELPSSLSCSSKLHFRRVSIRMQADDEDYELKQTKDLAAAKKRWEALVRDEKVKVLTPREAGYATQLSNKPLLDVRPSTERKKAWVKGSTWIPIFEVDNRMDPGTISRKVTSFMMGGWWSGIPILSFDSQFLPKVEEKFPKDTDLIVACQKGLRSLAACELLYNAGYKNLFWVQGGLESADEEDLVIEGPLPIKFAGIGGVSEFLG